MPSFTFVLPHWVYWGLLLIFPIVAMAFIARHRRLGVPREPQLFNACLFWITGGFMGLHRLYLKSWLGLVYLPLFCVVLWCNGEVRDSREDISRTTAALEQAETAVKAAAPIDAAAPTPEERKALDDATRTVRTRQAEAAAAEAVRDHWRGIALAVAVGIAVLMVIDALLLPGLVRRRRAQGVAAGYAADPISHEPETPQQGTAEDPTLHMRTPFTDWIDRMNGLVGEYVAYWGLLAVFAYYYEVVARFVFNSPTNWVHESMFLMFGMQYMLSGAYAYREDQHVRVDVLYTKLSTRGKAVADIVSSVFFFIFAMTLLWTGWRFAADAVGNGETSFTEWGIQYWPVKLTIPIGAALIILQGVSKLVKDILIVAHGRNA
jgi:TRAP-type mannitol/chloroaromatic compound transport system permease small subunit